MLRERIEPKERKKQGLQGVFNEVFPIESYDGRYVLDYVRYDLSKPALEALESLYAGLT